MMSNYFLKAVGVVASTLIALPVVAHNVEISNDVAATFHITPSHNPQAGKTVRAWFALTRRGGQSIPLSDCECQLNIYTVPTTTDAQPVLQPKLVAIDVEKYQDIPGADIVFPEAGAYKLKISGIPRESGSFSPFELIYDVNVRP